MLSQLSISNYALIDKVNVSLEDSLNIITGETGAGKSILIGALGLITGNRADFSVLKNKTIKCVVEAEFDISKLHLEQGFVEIDLDYDQHTIVRREILPNGKSRAFVNDTPANLNQLKWLGEKLLDIHSQHQTQLLNTSSFQLAILDAAANSNTEQEHYKGVYKDWLKVNKLVAELKQQEKENKEDESYLQFQLNELIEAKLDDVDLPTLEEELKTLEKSEEIIHHLNAINHAFNESELSILDQLKDACNKLNNIGDISATLKEFSERANSTLVELNDLSQEISLYADKVEVNPERLQLINDQVNLVYSLFQKHKTEEVSELIKLRDELENKLHYTASLEDKIAEALAKEQALYNKLVAAGKALHEKRAKACEPLATDVQTYLSDLGMENANLKVTLTKRKLPTIEGFNEINMEFSANKGLSHQPIDKVASGGELSRVMLAFKAILAQKETLPTIIFDEIDTGVSGEVAFKMGKMLKRISNDMQVISITHLPQIASRGKKHFKVVKDHSQDVSNSKIITLSSEERIVEIASMLSGNEVTEHALNNAKELLKNE